MASEAQVKASIKYDKKNAKNITLKMNKNNDKDILDHLAKVDNVNGYIKKLIRQEIENTK